MYTACRLRWMVNLLGFENMFIFFLFKKKCEVEYEIVVLYKSDEK